MWSNDRSKRESQCEVGDRTVRQPQETNEWEGYKGGRKWFWWRIGLRWGTDGWTRLSSHKIPFKIYRRRGVGSWSNLWPTGNCFEDWLAEHVQSLYLENVANAQSLQVLLEPLLFSFDQHLHVGHGGKSSTQGNGHRCAPSHRLEQCCTQVKHAIDGFCLL